MIKPPHFVVIGSGSIGKRHAENLVTLGAKVSHLSWRETGLEGVCKVLDIDRPQGAIIATATDIRLPIIALCAERGVPVYVEKPLAFRTSDVAAIFDTAAPIADRSLTGFMMRYHPIVQALQKLGVSDAFRFDFEIGHDVLQWRQNWHFSQSYAARAEGGGVLLDLCHELDMAHTLLPGLTLSGVTSLGHAEVPGVDMASVCVVSTPKGQGRVAMDYLTSQLVRAARFRCLDANVEADFVSSSLTVNGTRTLFDFDRNTMFLSAMNDFMALATGQTPPGGPIAPRLDLTRASSELIASAWEARVFQGSTEKRLT